MTHFLSCIKVTLAAGAVSMAALAANAETHDMGVLLPGETYSYPVYTTVTGQYTPTVTGPVKILYTTNPLTLYSSSDHSEESIVSGSHSYVTGGQMISYAELTAGKTYYLYSAMTVMAGELTIQEGSTDITVSRVNPDLADGELFSVSSNYTIDVSFNCPVTVGNALLVVGDSKTKVPASVSNSTVSCDVADAVMDLYRSGLVKKDDVMTLRLMKVADASDPNNRYGDNGKLEIDFRMAGKPAELVEVVNASPANTDNPFNSYYAETDETGVISFVFDTALSAETAPVAKLTYGNPDNLEVGVYAEEIPGINDGNVAAFDFTGKLRRPIDMLPASTSDTQPTHLHLLFSNICTEDGQRVYTGRKSNPTGYSMSFKMNLIQYSIASDFTPSKGSVLEAGDEMEIWVMNGRFVNFSGIRFDYTSGGEAVFAVVPKENIRIEVDPVSDDDMIFTFAVPDIAVDDNTNITISFDGLECGDGLDHSKELTAEYSYAVAGVEGICGDESGMVTVYNVAGVCVLRNAPRGQLGTLPQGLYIVNGKKMTVR